MFLSEAEKSIMQRKLGLMKDEVTILIFAETDALSMELLDFAHMIESFSPRVKLDVQNPDGGKNAKMRNVHVGRWPMLLLVKGEFNRIRYYGIPLGYETSAFADALVELSSSTTPLSPKAKTTLSTLRRKANIKVFVLPTCPFCPTVARHAYRGAIESQKVTAEIIDSQMFPDIATHHAVMGVPKIVLNDNLDITGAITDVEFFDKLRESDHALLDSMYG
jgi:glutaredoxin-like protein